MAIPHKKEKTMMRKETISTYAPGILLAAVIAAAAKWLETLMPQGISASVIALFIGMMIHTIKNRTLYIKKESYSLPRNC